MCSLISQDSTRPASFFILLIYPHSEQVLERKLHDAGIQRVRDLTEGVAVEGIKVCRAVEGVTFVERSPAEAIGHVECFGADLDALFLTHLKDSRKSHIQYPSWRSNQVIRPHITDCAEGRRSERFLV